MEEKNIFKASSRYFTICIYSVLTVLIVALVIKTIFFWDSTSKIIGAFFSTLSPFFIGIIIAFLINPLVAWVRRTVLIKWLHIKNDALNKLLAIFISYILVLAVITLGLLYLIPEIISSIQLLMDQIPSWATGISKFVNSLSTRYPSLDFKYVDQALDQIKSTLSNSLNDIIKSTTSAIVFTGVGIVKALFNFIVAVIVSCYLLIDKRMQARNAKRMIYAAFKKERADKICYVIKRSVSIFSDFFDGKMIDSIIMCLICFVCMMVISLFGVEGFASCAILVSIIVGITNIIPYFGPFLGGIPSILLLCIHSPKSGLIFAILIIVLQQVDGNLIGPKILGNSTGLRPLWIIFAITIGGWVAGILGMFLGVPVVAVITGLTEEHVNKKLEQKGIVMPVLKNEKVRKPKEPKIIIQAPGKLFKKKK